MTDQQTAIINRFADDRAEVVGASRFFNNERVSQKALIEATRAACERAARKDKGKQHVLAIQDTTELNYADHDGQLEADDPELGPVGNDRDVGFFFHPTLAIEAKSGFPLGFADAYLWNRSWDKKDKHQRNYAQQPIEEKESYRWIQASRQAKQTLQNVGSQDVGSQDVGSQDVGSQEDYQGVDQVTIIADREGDIYEELVEMPDERTDVLIRSRSDRRLATSSQEASSADGGSLYDKLANSPSAGSYKLEVPGTNGRRKRTARLEVRFRQVEIQKPTSNHHAESLPESVELCAIEAREKQETVPEREDPIRWRLLTSRSVETFEEARRAIAHYGKRSKIEQVFRLLKSEGLTLERSQLEEGAALKKLCLLAAQVALALMQLVEGREGEAGEKPAQLVFGKEALGFMGELAGKLEGTTQKQKCPFERGTLAWGSWIVGRLGGWKGYARSDPPGPITMRRGLERLQSQLAGWKLAQSG
jgi:hypothetical protein